MFIYFLIALIGFQIIKRLRYQPFSWDKVLNYLIPYWKKGDGEDRLLGILQIFIVICISLLEAGKTEGTASRIIVFVLTFISFIWLIKILIETVEWLEEYLHIMTINIVFTVTVPLVILLNAHYIRSLLEIKICFIALLMSIIVVYSEIIGIVIGAGNYKYMAKEMTHNNGLKLKSILTWFFIILENLYALILFIQFYIGGKAHHFIEAEELTRDSAIDLFYYLIVTFTTVGFGDISPNTEIAKLVTALIALSGMLFTGIFVGCVLTLEE